MLTVVVIVLVLAYAFLLAMVLHLNWLLYKRGEELAEAKHRESRASLIIGDLVEDERKRQRAEEREVIDFLA